MKGSARRLAACLWWGLAAPGFMEALGGEGEVFWRLPQLLELWFLHGI